MLASPPALTKRAGTGLQLLGVPIVLFIFAPGAYAQSASEAQILAQWKFDRLDPEAWQCNSPADVEISCAPEPRPPEGEANRALAVRILRANSNLEICGPEFTLSPGTEFDLRQLELELAIRAEGLSDGSVQIRFRQKSQTGEAWVYCRSPGRNWDRLVDMPAAHEWKDWVTLNNVGTIDTPTLKIAPVIMINAGERDIGGRLLLDDWGLKLASRPRHLIKLKEIDHIFCRDQVDFDVEFAPGPGIGSGAVIIRDESGSELERIPATQGRAECRLREPGFYTIEAVGDYESGRKVSTQATAVVTGNESPEAQRGESRYGICVSQGSIESAFKLGARLKYEYYPWQSINLTADSQLEVPPFKERDRRFRTALAGTGRLPDWLTGRNGDEGLRPPQDWGRFEELVETWARGIGPEDRPETITAFNESDAHWRGSFDDFVRFHQSFNRALKRALPQTLLSGPNMYSIRMDIFKKYAEAGALDGLDAIMMHAYVNATPPEGEFIGKVEQLLAYLAETGRGQLPIYFTEFGWTVPPGDWQTPVDELTRARYLARAMILLTTHRQIAGIIPFVLRSSFSAAGYSLLVYDGHPRYGANPTLGASVYAAVVRQLAGVRSGRWLRLSPTRNLCLFPAGADTKLALWDTAGPGRQELPQPPVEGADMTGRPLGLGEAQVPVSPSPVYVRLPGQELLDSADGTVQNCLPGAVIALAAERVILAPPLTWTGQDLIVPTEAQPGEYGLLAGQGQTWRFVPLRVEAPLVVDAPDLQWTGGKTAALRFTLHSRCPTVAQVKLTGNFTGGQTQTTEVEVPALGTVQVELAFTDLEPGQRYRGAATAQLLTPINWRVETPLDLTLIACPRLAQSPDAETWSRLPVVDFSGWEPLPAPLPAEDASAQLRLAASPAGLHLRLTVRDDQHCQEALWNRMWKEDSIQVAFDVDVDREWQPNNVGFGFNGHRIFEWGLALAPNDRTKIQAWRFRAEAPNRKSGPEYGLKTEIERDEAARITDYGVTIPWSSLDLPDMPAPGSRLGFALLVNDKDTDRPRRRLQLFSGIAQSKDPVNYGKIWLF